VHFFGHRKINSGGGPAAERLGGVIKIRQHSDDPLHEGYSSVFGLASVAIFWSFGAVLGNFWQFWVTVTVSGQPLWPFRVTVSVSGQPPNRRFGL
jgi:hypothetical protein